MLLIRGGIRGGQLLQDLVLGDGPEKVRFTHLADALKIVELSALERLGHKPIVAFKEHRVSGPVLSVSVQGFSLRS